MGFEVIVLQVVSGLSEGMVVFLCAMGLTLILGSLKVLNISHGSMYMIGAYCMVAVNAALSSIPGGFFIGVIVTMIVVAIIGGVLEILLIRPVYKLNDTYQYITTFAVTFIVTDLLKFIWGGAYLTTPYPSFLVGPFMLGDIILPKYNIALIAFALFVFVCMHFFINKSNLGLLVRGMTVDREMMGVLGVNVPLVYTLVFMLGCGLAGLGGSLIAPISAAGLGIDLTVLIASFAVIVIGGFGSIGGALIASIILGLVNAFGVLLVPKAAVGFMYFVMVVTLIFRPWGLLGKPITMK